MPARCPFCEAVHPIRTPPEPSGQQLECPCGAVGILCAANTEPEVAIRLVEMGLRDTRPDVLDDTLSIVWGRDWSWWRT